jgi:hypothetical protein
LLDCICDDIAVCKIGVVYMRLRDALQINRQRVWPTSRSRQIQLSCRHIKFQMLQRLYQRFGASRTQFSFHLTDRNGPVQERSRVFFPAGVPTDRLELTAGVFEQNWPQSFQVIRIN